MTQPADWAWLNGGFVKAAEAKISPFDRGFLFAHAAYEVTAVYNGALIDWPAHQARLARTLDGLELPAPGGLGAVHRDLVARNALKEGLVYLQVSGGAYGLRDFVGPEVFSPTVFLFATPKRLIGAAARNGLAAISAPDLRWKRRDWKTTQLLSQTQAYRAAIAAGADTAILHEDGVVTEAASANIWIVDANGRLRTRDLSHALLPGITRARVKDLLARQGLETLEGAFTLDDLRAAREAFTTSTGVVIAPVLALDGAPVGDGGPGPVTRQVQRLYYAHMGADVAAVAPWAMA